MSKKIAKKCEQKNIQTDLCLCLKINRQLLNYDKDLFILSVYIPPYNTRYSNVGMFDELAQIILDIGIENNHVLICGDMNGHTQERDDFDVCPIESDGKSLDVNTGCESSTVEQLEVFNIPLKRKSLDKHIDFGNYGKALLEMCKNLPMCILNGRCGDDAHIGNATTVDNSVIDYMIGVPFVLSKVKHFCVHSFDSLFSDKHCLVEVILEVNHGGEHCRANTPVRDELRLTDTIAEKRIGKWEKEKEIEFTTNIDLDKVENLLCNVDSMSVNEITKCVCDIMIKSAMTTFPKTQKQKKNLKLGKRKIAAWFNRECREKRKEYRKVKRMLEKHRSVANAECLREKSKEYRRVLHKAQRAHRKKLSDELMSMKSENPKLYWKKLNDSSKIKSVCPITVEEFHDHFENLSDGGVPIDELQELESDGQIIDSIVLNVCFTEQEINEAIRKIKPGKAAGIDTVLNEYIKSTSTIFMPLYVLLFNKILDSGVIPEDWVLGLIVPIYKKKGDKRDCDNYRGITLLSCLGKLFTNVLNERLCTFCEDNSTLKENQAGFRKNYSTVDHIFLLKQIIDLYRFKKKSLFCCFIDYSKAFDTVWRDALWHKLLKIGIEGKFLNLVINMYKNIKSCVYVNGAKSEFFASLTGVRQGENLSPLLFALFINDLEDYLLQKGCEPITFDDAVLDNYIQLMALMYADDTIIMSTTKRGLQKAINHMCDFCEKWKLKINSDKTKVTVFGFRRADTSTLQFVCNGQSLETVHCFRYLGVIMNYNGSFKIAIEELHKQALRAMFALLNKCRKLQLSVDVTLDLFDKLVTPVMLYACEVWGFEKLHLLEKLHLKFLKYILKVKMTTCSHMVYGELGRYPLCVTVKKRIIGYWGRLLESKESKLSKIMYNQLHSLHSSGAYASPWVSQVKQILDDCGLSYIWITQKYNNINWLKKIVEQKLKDQFIQRWQSELTSMTSCDTYIEFKQEFKLEKYLMYENQKSRQAICNFRTNNTRIPKVTGRYKGLERSERMCNICDSHCVGDEYHVLFECKNVNVMYYRKKYLPKYYVYSPSKIKLILLLRSNNPGVIAKTGAFLRNVLPLFK